MPDATAVPTLLTAETPAGVVFASPALTGAPTEAAAATLPQLQGFTSFPTTLFLGRDGRIRLVHAGYLGPATGAQHGKQVEEFEREVERLLGAGGRDG